jgi:hypothetical protein
MIACCSNGSKAPEGLKIVTFLTPTGTPSSLNFPSIAVVVERPAVVTMHRQLPVRYL